MLNPITWITGRSSKPASVGKPQAADKLEKRPEEKDLKKIVPEMRKDYQVSFCERIIRANIASIQVNVSSDNAAAEGLTQKLQALWDQAAAAMGDDFAYGRVAYEITWDYCDGYHVPRKLEALPFEDSRLKLVDGTFAGVDIRTADHEWHTITPQNCWWQALDATTVYPHGRSRFLGAPHETWKDKFGAKENRRTATRKWALRGPIIRMPMTEFDEQAGQPFDTMSAMAPAVDIWAKGGLLGLPNDMHPTKEGGFKYEVIQADLQGFDPNALNVTLERLDVELCRAFGIPEKTITEGQGVGSYAMVSQQMQILFNVCEDVLSQRVQSFERYVIGKTEAANGLPKGTITIGFTPLTSRPDAFGLEIIKLLVANPTFVEAILSGGVDLRKMLEDAGLPVTEQLEAALLAAAQRLAAASPAAPSAAPMAGSAEFGGLGRRQWQNNVKAIRDVLQDVIDGKATEAMAKELLQTLGLPPERAQVLIDDARDGTVSDPELAQPAAMTATLGAKIRIPDGPKVPTTEALLSSALDEFDRLFLSLVDAMTARASQSTLDAIRNRILDLETEVRTAGRVLGMASFWAPKVDKYAKGNDAPQAPLKLADGVVRYPWINSAVEWLKNREVVTSDQWSAMAEADRRKVFSAPGIDSASTLRKIQAQLAKSLEKGDDLKLFREAVKDDLALSRAQTETLYRTETKRGYVAGFDHAIKSPLVKKEFPAVMFAATADTRVRDEHWDLDGFVCLRSDPAYKVLRRAVEDYNCRCTLIPIGLEDAESRGVKTLADVPSAVRAKYA